MTDKPIRVQLKRTKGWRMPENTISVTRGRGRKWGNPFVVGQSYPVLEDESDAHPIAETGPLTAADAVKLYREQGEWLGCFDGIEALRGKNLACFCKPGEPCHADVLLELANAPEAGRT